MPKAHYNYLGLAQKALRGACALPVCLCSLSSQHITAVKIASRGFNTKAFFSGRFKLSSVFQRVNSPNPPNVCSKRHSAPYFPCRNHCIYSNLLSCCSRYIEQSARCVNDRVRERANKFKNATLNPSVPSLHPIAPHIGIFPC